MIVELPEKRTLGELGPWGASAKAIGKQMRVSHYQSGPQDTIAKTL
jgi:hypothetical protein